MGNFGFPAETVIIFFVVIALSVYLDLFAHRKSQEITIKDAALWSVFWIGLSLSFYLYLLLRFDQKWADLFLTGYVLEKTLSVDNLMVFMAIFLSFGIKGALQHRILYWGIIGALLFRGIFVVLGTSLFQASVWVGFVFAAIVAWTGWKMLTSGGDQVEIVDYSDHWSVRMAKKVVPVFPRLHLEKFFITRKIVEDLQQDNPDINVHGRGANTAAFFATPAFLALIAIETSDILFAFDSVPAIIAVTQEPLLVYAAMIFAILGLRSLYFVLAAMTKYLVHLEKAVIALLFFIAFKLALQSWNHAFGETGFYITANASLLIVLGALAVGVIASFVFPEKKERSNESNS